MMPGVTTRNAMRFHRNKMLGKSTLGQEMGSSNLALPPWLVGVVEVSKVLDHQSPVPGHLVKAMNTERCGQCSGSLARIQY